MPAKKICDNDALRLQDLSLLWFNVAVTTKGCLFFNWTLLSIEFLVWPMKGVCPVCKDVLVFCRFHAAQKVYA
jgi:hypothetical protein